jgi:glycolate oxidase iron-sulfur subunit
MPIREQYDEIARCNRCGFCQVACPIFRATGNEAGVARGRLAMLRALVEGRATWSKDLEDPLFACLLCGACTANCFPAVATADLITAARSEYLEKVGRNPLHKLLFDHMLPYPARVRLAGQAARLGKKTRASKAAKALGLLRCFGRSLVQSEEIIEHFPSQAFRQTVKPGEYSGEGDSLRLGYFVGCGTDVMYPGAGEAALRLLRQIGKTVTVLDNCCCGFPPVCYGEQVSAQRLAARNIALLSSKQLDLIVTDCSSCAAFLKKYPKLFPPHDPRHEAAKLLAPKLRDLLEVATLPAEPPLKKEDRIVVTYHDSCHAVRGQGLASHPRRILKSLEGIEYRELAEADWCCGGAGSYALSHYDLSHRVLDRKMANVARTGAQILATSCPACIIQLSYGVRKHQLPVRVCHFSEVLASAVE